MFILIDIMEPEQEYVDSTREKVSKSQAKKLRNNLADWLIRNPNHDNDSDDDSSALTLREEINRRMRGRMVETQKEGKQLVLGIKEDLSKWFLEQD